MAQLPLWIRLTPLKLASALSSSSCLDIGVKQAEGFKTFNGSIHVFTMYFILPHFYSPGMECSKSLPVKGLYCFLFAIRHCYPIQIVELAGFYHLNCYCFNEYYDSIFCSLCNLQSLIIESCLMDLLTNCLQVYKFIDICYNFDLLNHQRY